MKRYGEWLCRRLHMCIWKQWKKVSKRMRSLIQLGIDRQKAYGWANTRKGYWRVSKSPILHRAITTERLEERGYPSIEKIYLHRHSILMNRRDTRTVRPVV
jgi:RNA-directed DNA polymerase